MFFSLFLALYPFVLFILYYFYYISILQIPSWFRLRVSIACRLVFLLQFRLDASAVICFRQKKYKTHTLNHLISVFPRHWVWELFVLSLLLTTSKTTSYQSQSASTAYTQIFSSNCGFSIICARFALFHWDFVSCSKTHADDEWAFLCCCCCCCWFFT